MVREILDLVILIFKILKCLKSFYTNKLSIIDFIDVEIPPWIDQINSCTITLEKYISEIPYFMTDVL